MKPYRLKQKCRLCECKNLNLMTTLRNMPAVAQYFPTKQKSALKLLTDIDIFECEECLLWQILGNPVPYFKEVIRSSSVSLPMTNFRKDQLNRFINKYNLFGKRLIEIGSGKGDILDILSLFEVDCFGMEYNPSFVKESRNRGLKVYNGYINDQKTRLDTHTFDAFFSFNVLEHAPNPKLHLQNIIRNLSENAVGIIEVPSLNMILEKNMLSEFMLEHLTYFSNETLSNTIEMSGFEIMDLKSVWNDYILSAEVKVRSKNRADNLERGWVALRSEVNKYFGIFDHKSVVVWGAGHQSLATISLLEIESWIKYIVDSSQMKQGKFSPGLGFPIFNPDYLKEDTNISAVFVLGGSFSEEIVESLMLNFNRQFAILTLDGVNLKIKRDRIG